MADRSVVVRLRAEVSAFKAGMDQSATAAEKVGKATQDSAKKSDQAITGLSGSLRKNSADWNRVGNAAMLGGAAIVAGLGLAAKAAIDWETAWAGVTKTVDGTAAQMGELEGGLRGLSRTLPATQTEIAGVAEAAGQLGVKRGDILDFTKTMIGLGVSTNLTADEAATSIAQISNVMGTLDRDGAKGVERFASTLVALGNAGASTEADIVSMATRLSGAGKIIGASESDVLALSNAMASVGIEAQLGGGVMSRVMLQINSAVKKGGDGLNAFAKVSGISAQEFSKRWEADPVTAIDSFLKGLSQINATGGDAAGTLSDLGLKGTENASVLLRMAGAGDLLTDSIKLGAEAWAQNTALQDEAGKRYATTASQLEIAKNNAKDAAINFGSVLAPAVASASKAVSGLSGFLADLPPGLQKSIVGVGAFGGASLLAVGGGIKLATTVSEMRDSLAKMSAASPGAARGIGMVSTAIKGLAAAGLIAAGTAAAVKALVDLSNDDFKVKGIETLTKDLLNASDLSKQLDATFNTTGQTLNGSTRLVTGFGDALQTALNPSGFQKFEDTFAGMIGESGKLDVVRKQFEGMDATLSGLVSSGHAEKAQELFAGMSREAQTFGVGADKLMTLLPQYGEGLAGVANAAQLTGDKSAGATGGVDEFGKSIGTTGDAGQEAADKLDKLLKAITDLGSAFGDERSSASAYNQGIADNVKVIEKYGKAHLDAAGNIKLTTEAGRAQEEALQGQADRTLQWASNMAAAGASQKDVTAKVAAGRDEFIKQAKAMDIPAAAAKVLADRYGLIPEDVTTLFEAQNAEVAAAQVKDLNTAISQVKPEVGTYVTAPGAAQAKVETDALTTSIFNIPTETGAYVKAPGATQATAETEGLKSSLFSVPTSTSAKVSVPGASPSITLTNALTTSLYKVPDWTKANVSVTGASGGAAEVANLRHQIDLLHSKTVNVRYTVSGRLPNGGTGTGGGSTANADGNILTFADGGQLPPIGAQQPQIQPNRGPQGIMWAETGAGPWEAFISGHPAKAERSRGIADDVVGRLGGQVMWPKRFADGGVMGGQAGAVDFASILDIVRQVTGWDDVTSSRSNRSSKAAAVTTAKNTLASLIAQQRKAARDLTAARRALATAHTAKQRAAARDDISTILDRQRVLLGKVAAAEGKVTAARNASAAAAKATKKVEAEYRADSKPILERTITAGRLTNSRTRTFLNNIDKLTKKGFKALALELLDMGGDEAEGIAAQAVKSASRAKALQAEFGLSASLSAREAALRNSLEGVGAVSSVGAMSGLVVQQPNGTVINVAVNADAGLAREYGGYMATKAKTALKDTVALYNLSNLKV